jgi:GTP-binding protein
VKGKCEMNYKKATFMLSVANLHQLPIDAGFEVAFVGRSNAGKSSVLNELTQNKQLARVSKTPGRTQHINLFSLDENCRIADLPGYGYAKVPAEIKTHWEKTLDEYLRTRQCLKGLVIVMDSRHPLKEFDQHMLAWSEDCGLAVHILLNKADKLSQSLKQQTLLQVEKALKNYSNSVSVQLFSALRHIGNDKLKQVLDRWFSGA